MHVMNNVAGPECVFAGQVQCRTHVSGSITSSVNLKLEYNRGDPRLSNFNRADEYV